MVGSVARQIRSAWWIAWRAFLHGRGRSVYLIAMVAVTVGACLVLAAMSSRFLGQQDSVGGQELNIQSARGKSDYLPLRYARTLAATDGVAAVKYLTVLLVNCPGGKTLTLNAIGGSGVTSELAPRFDQAVIAAWRDDPLGVLIGPVDAAQCGWRAGSPVSPINVLNQQSVVLHVTGIATQAAGMQGLAYMHYDYANRISNLAGKNNVLFFTVTGTQPGRINHLAQRIERAFASADPPVVAYPDTVVENGWARFGKVQNLLALVMLALFLCGALVLMSVMAHCAEERRPCLALQRVLGFSHASLWLAFALECLLSVSLGGLLGLGLGHVAIDFLPDMLHGLFGTFVLPQWAGWLMPLALLAVATLALVAPARTVWRVQTTECGDR